MFPIRWNFPFRKKDGSISTIGAEIESGGGGGGYTLPTASAETKGGVKIGTGLTMTGEVLSNNNPTPYVLPAASVETLGGVKVGAGLSIDDGVIKDNSTVLTELTGLQNVESGSELKISNNGDIFTISGEVLLTNPLEVGGRIQIGSGSIPENARVGSGWCPMVVTMTDANVTKFTIATLTVYANGNIFINNNFADITAKRLFVCCSYRKMNY